MENKQAVVFAFYKGDKLMGYRQNTVGTIGMSPKVYPYSKEQVEICLNNIRNNVKNESKIGKALANAYGPSVESEFVSQSEEKIYNTLQDSRAFEVRVLKAPDYKYEFDVNKAENVINYFSPYEELPVWMQNPETHEVIETHYFSFDGQINVQ